MAFNVRFYVDRLEKASASLTTVGAGGFTDGGGAALNFQEVDTYSPGSLSASACSMKMDSDLSASGGTVTTGYTFVAVWIRNYPSAGFGAGAVLTVYSDDNSGFTTTVNRGSLTFAAAGISASQHLMLITFASTTERYWWFEFSVMGTAPQVGMVLLGSTYDITSRWNSGATPGGMDSRHGLRQFNQNTDLTGGSRLRRSMRTNGAEQLVRSWELISKTNYDTMTDVFEATRGSYLPFIMVEDDLTAMSAHRLCTLGIDSLAEATSEPVYQLYNVALPIIQMPYSNSGETF